jgi:hypothetical protein
MQGHEFKLQYCQEKKMLIVTCCELFFSSVEDTLPLIYIPSPTATALPPVMGKLKST